MRVFVMDASRNGQRQFKFITALVLRQKDLCATGVLCGRRERHATSLCGSVELRLSSRFRSFLATRMHDPCASVIRSLDCAVDLQVKTQHVSHAQRFSSTSAFERANLNR